MHYISTNTDTGLVRLVHRPQQRSKVGSTPSAIEAAVSSPGTSAESAAGSRSCSTPTAETGNQATEPKTRSAVDDTKAPAIEGCALPSGASAGAATPSALGGDDMAVSSNDMSHPSDTIGTFGIGEETDGSDHGDDSVSE